MATSYVYLVVKVSNQAAADIKAKHFATSGLGAGGARRAIGGAAKLLDGMAGGVIKGVVTATVIDDAGTKPSGTIVCTRANASTDYVRFSFGGINITLTEATDFVRGASDTTCGDNLATAINAHATLKNLMTAAAVTGTVTLTMKFPTALGHSITMSTSDATAFALTAFASGTAGAAQFFPQTFQTGPTP